jgi:hypothetical protein
MRLRGNQSRPPAEPASRRSFLRRAGLASALTVGLAGGADLLGMSAASAATRRRTTKAGPEGCHGVRTCVPAAGKCGGPCQPSGHCCYHCTGCGGAGYYSCEPSCANPYLLCCPV